MLPVWGPLTEREREVVNLIVRGCSNREIAEELVIAEGTAVRHVANILNKLDLHSWPRLLVALLLVSECTLRPGSTQKTMAWKKAKSGARMPGAEAFGSCRSTGR
jgi:DNA-binding NarL/FixJ family response regulator